MESVWCGRHHQPPAEALCKHIDVPLAHVFNLSLRSGRFPATWKQARVQPVFKQKGDRSSPGSYRPIALLCSVSKVFETLVKDQVLSFCLANRVLPDSQFGFLPGRSTVWYLFWMTGMQQGKGAPQSMPPFWTWQKPLIALTTRF